MKFIHLSDLHIGKRLNNFFLYEDQKYILDKIIGIVKTEKPDLAVIAGDVYDRSLPPSEAVELFDSFLSRLSSEAGKVFIISGNHDSARRIAYASELLAKSGVYVSPVYNGDIRPVTLNDEYGEFNVYMLPYVSPNIVGSVFKDTEIKTYDDAVRRAVGEIKPDLTKRNIMIAHQFVTGAAVGDSERLIIGGLEDVGADIFEDFDYTALGHIHGAQKVKDEKIRYCGTPLKYSVNEGKKSVTIVEIKEKGSLDIKTQELLPLRDVRKIKGKMDELMKNEPSEDYIQIILTDENEILEAQNRLRSKYPNMIALSYENSYTDVSALSLYEGGSEDKTPSELLKDFYFKMHGEKKSLDEMQQKFADNLITKIWSDI